MVSGSSLYWRSPYRPGSFYPTGLAFRFDPGWARARSKYYRVFPENVRSCGLARPIDKAAEIERDPHLAALAEWATTIVKLPFSGRFPEWLQNDILEFLHNSFCSLRTSPNSFARTSGTSLSAF